jgi:hypothetical protein
MIYDFQNKLAMSKGSRLDTDKETIQKLLDGCVLVETACAEMDKIGVDYIATLRMGAKVYIDAKTRDLGCSRYWNGCPEVAIELWSVMPNGKYKIDARCARAGWTLDECKVTDMILYIWHPQDSEVAYLFPFQNLRMAARRNIMDWMLKYKTDIQDSGKWQSKAVFVPVNEVVRSIIETFTEPVHQAPHSR